MASATGGCGRLGSWRFLKARAGIVAGRDPVDLAAGRACGVQEDDSCRRQTGRRGCSCRPPRRRPTAPVMRRSTPAPFSPRSAGSPMSGPSPTTASAGARARPRCSACRRSRRSRRGAISPPCSIRRAPPAVTMRCSIPTAPTPAPASPTRSSTPCCRSAGSGKQRLIVEDAGRWYAGENGQVARARGVVRVINERAEREERRAFLIALRRTHRLLQPQPSARRAGRGASPRPSG